MKNLVLLLFLGIHLSACVKPDVALDGENCKANDQSCLNFDDQGSEGGDSSVDDNNTDDVTRVRVSSQAIAGFVERTLAVEATGDGTRYDIGGGNNFGTELSDVPWQDLKPGDAVNIYHRNTPYRHKVLLTEQGSKENPIVINGVTDVGGNRPVINGANAVSINPSQWNPSHVPAIMVFYRKRVGGVYGQNASHYLIKNLRITGARETNSYTHDGVTQNYGDWSRAIWSAGGQYITLEGMVIDDNGSGVFVQAADDPGILSKTWVIRGCKFENNGHGARDHQIYLQSVSDPGEYNIIEGNYFGAPTPGQESIAQAKIRSTGVVVRYNWFNSAHRTLDIVEAQDAIPDWMYNNFTGAEVLKYYRSSYVYGNVFVNDFKANTGQPAARPIHFGADSFDTPEFSTAGRANGQPGLRGYEAPTYFFYNTFYMRADTSDAWRGALFDMENNNQNLTSTPGATQAWNNIIEFAGNTRISAANRTGTVDFAGANLLNTSELTIFGESDSYANTENSGDDPNVLIQYSGAIETSSALFVDPGNLVLANKDFRLQGNSPAIGKAVDLPAILNEFPLDLQPAGTSGGAILRETADDLGALEY